VPHQN